MDLYDDAVERFRIIAAYWEKSRYARSSHDGNSSGSRIIREFFGDQLVECLESVDFEKIGLLPLKETFRFTLSWKRPAIQKAILSRISDENRPELFTSDGLHCSDPIIFDLIRVDDTKIAEVVLPEIVKVNPQLLLVLNGRRRSALEFSLSTDRFNIMELIFKSIEDKALLRQYIVCDWGAFMQIYQYRKMTKLVQSNIADEDIGKAVLAAVEFDEDMEFTQSLLDRVSSEDEKHKILREFSGMECLLPLSESIDFHHHLSLCCLHLWAGWNSTIFAVAASCRNRRVMEWVMKDVVKNDGVDNILIYTEPDFQYLTPFPL